MHAACRCKGLSPFPSITAVRIACQLPEMLTPAWVAREYKGFQLSQRQGPVHTGHIELQLKLILMDL